MAATATGHRHGMAATAAEEGQGMAVAASVPQVGGACKVTRGAHALGGAA